MRRWRLLVLAAAAAHVLGCSWLGPKPPPRPPSRADRTYEAGAAAMRAGEYERALELFSAAWKEAPGHDGVAADFPAALENLKAGGDEAFRQGNFEEAGLRWAAAARYAGHPAARGAPPGLARGDLKSSMDRASAALMEKGLVEYRKGNLGAAIASWKAILAYDPSHEEAAKSVRTATTQLENLKKLPPPSPSK